MCPSSDFTLPSLLPNLYDFCSSFKSDDRLIFLRPSPVDSYTSPASADDEDLKRLGPITFWDEKADSPVLANKRVLRIFCSSSEGPSVFYKWACI